MAEIRHDEIYKNFKIAVELKAIDPQYFAKVE